MIAIAMLPTARSSSTSTMNIAWKIGVNSQANSEIGFGRQRAPAGAGTGRRSAWALGPGCRSRPGRATQAATQQRRCRRGTGCGAGRTRAQAAEVRVDAVAWLLRGQRTGS